MRLDTYTCEKESNGMRCLWIFPLLAVATMANGYVTEAPSEVRARLYNEMTMDRSFSDFKLSPSQAQLSAAIPANARSTVTSTWNCSIKLDGSLSDCNLESFFPEGIDKSKTRRLLRLIAVKPEIVKEAVTKGSRLSIVIFQNDPKRRLRSTSVPGRCAITLAPPPAPK